jgi:hypothetical protein
VETSGRTGCATRSAGGVRLGTAWQLYADVCDPECPAGISRAASGRASTECAANYVNAERTRICTRGCGAE